MWLRIACLLLLPLMLGSCSYAYDLLAVVRGGRLAFIVDPASVRRPPCVRQIDVVSERRVLAKAEPADDADRVGYGTFWSDSVSHEDRCTNHFPLVYGAALKGARLADRGLVIAKPLVREEIYEVATTSGATGYGGGRFVIHQDGRVENLPPAYLTETNKVAR